MQPHERDPGYTKLRYIAPRNLAIWLGQRTSVLSYKVCCKSLGDYFNLYNFFALSRSTMFASSIARSRVISPSCIISVRANPSACRPVVTPTHAASSQYISVEKG